MAAFLRQHLIFDLDGRGTGLLETVHRVHDVENLTKAGISVHQQRKARGPDDLSGEEQYVFQRQDTEVGKPHGCAHRRSGQIQRLEARCFCLEGGKAAMRARHSDNVRRAQEGS